ncbi:unnamed protein product [Allacma fusca]|uniref:Phospholipid-transporting ATPase n=1 Tax=Allacma fusca TaxID=39272 RepID=A0A8J2JN59_9HEXA|nr:unnamed protein product [Allacma fusca]
MGIFKRLLQKLKRRTAVNSDQGHRLIYFGNVPIIESVDPGYLQDLTASSTATTVRNDEDPGFLPQTVPTTRTFRNKYVPNKEKKAMKSNRDRRNREFPNNQIKTSRYSLLNFIPKNLFEQFRRVANFYFLCMSVIQMVIDSPVDPYTAAAPLVFVILSTAIKQGYEDWLRHKADANVNNRPVCVVRDQKLMVIKARDVNVGDIVRLEGEDQVPADILVVGSSDEFLRCQITTANLDGETNLKMRYCPAGLLQLNNEKNFSRLHVIVECEQPNHSLYEFNGCILLPPYKLVEGVTDSDASMRDPNTPISRDHEVQTQTIPNSSDNFKRQSGWIENEPPSVSDFLTIPLTMENIILRGARVKNTDFIFGLVVYTGKDTRLAQNSKQSTIKHSTVEKAANSFLFAFIIILILMVIFSTSFHYWWEEAGVIKDASYVGPPSITDIAREWTTPFFSFFILFNYIIPISLYVTVELQKFFGSKFFVYDLEMTCPVTEHPPLCNTSDLNEELGQIEYLFTDKTGTLTENIMQFRHVSVGGDNYDFIEDSLFFRNKASKVDVSPIDIENTPSVIDFLKILALCHSVQLMPIRRPSFESAIPGMNKDGPIVKDAKPRASSTLFGLGGNSEPAVGILGKWEYQASSPDEKALLESCYRLDVKYLGERGDMLTLDVFKKVENFRRHYVLEFDPDRKCMSVILENQKGEIWLLCKGAESTIIPRCDAGPAEEVMKSVIEFAMIGMRTLVVAKRQLMKEELRKFSHKLKSARRLIQGREEAMRELYKSVESRLVCVGATGVEDQLQSGVPEMLMSLNAAGVRIWMLTGDKIETGISVGVACGLITQASKQFYCTNGTDKNVVKAHLEQIKNEITPDENNTLIVDGATLEIAFSECPDLLSDVALAVYRVICCRMAPLQKAQIVHMVKQSKKKPITAAVGDGANDVAMIQEAHLGIGILGKEGRQAARSGDFALARSSFLKKAILVHGHWYYVRLAILVLYFFYKNIVFIGPQFIFCFYTAFSTQSLYNGWSLMVYNIFYTSCPIFTYGLQEQPYSAKILMANPHFVVAVVNMKIAIETKFWSGWTVFSLFFSFASMFILSSIYSETAVSIYFEDAFQDFRHVYFTLLSKLSFWMIIAASVLMSLIPDVVILVYYNSNFRLGRICRLNSQEKENNFPTGRSVLNLSYIGNLQAPKTIDLVRRISCILPVFPNIRRKHCIRNGIYLFSPTGCLHEDHSGWLSPVQCNFTVFLIKTGFCMRFSFSKHAVSMLLPLR